MKTLSILAATMTVGVLSAQDAIPSLDARLTAFGEMIRPQKLDVVSGVTAQPGTQISPGIRFLGQLGAGSRWYYELAGRAESSSNMVNIDSVGDYSKVKLTYSYWSVGGGYLLPVGSNFDIGFHLEARAENIRCQGTYIQAGVSADADGGNSFIRPWARVSLEIGLSSGPVKPLIGFDAAIAMIRTYQTEIQPLSSMDDRTTRSLAPQYSASVFAGVRF